MDLSEEQEAFISMLGNCSDLARSAGITVQLELHDGLVVEGVPRSNATGEGGAEIDHTGVQPYLELDGSIVMLERVRSYRVLRP